jgi:hypothetical protein
MVRRRFWEVKEYFWEVKGHCTWSIAQGMRQGMSFRFPKMWGKLVGKQGAASMEGKWIFPMQSASSTLENLTIV